MIAVNDIIEWVSDSEALEMVDDTLVVGDNEWMSDSEVLKMVDDVIFTAEEDIIEWLSIQEETDGSIYYYMSW